MEKIVKRLFLGGTLVVALAASLTAFSAYADETAEGVTKFKFNIPSVMELSNVAGVSIDQANVGNVNEREITANVTSSTDFVLKVSATTPALTATGGATIPATANVQGGVSGWGIKNNSTNAYQAVTTTPETFYTGTPINGSVSLPVGIGVSPTQAYGTYSTVVTLTLAAAQ